jgi:hypothetical protein
MKIPVSDRRESLRHDFRVPIRVRFCAREFTRHAGPSLVMFDPRMAQRTALLEVGAERRFVDRDGGRGFEKRRAPSSSVSGNSYCWVAAVDELSGQLVRATATRHLLLSYCLWAARNLVYAARVQIWGVTRALR